jgi:hypothetical protein
MTARAMIKEETEISTEWNNIMSKEFSKTKEKYTFVRFLFFKKKLISKQLVGIYIIVVIKTQHVKKVQNLKTQIARLKILILTLKDVGVGGYVGNKGFQKNYFTNSGAIGVRFDFYETSMCFICMHLVPGQSAYLKRNQNLSDIFDLLKFDSFPLKKHE